MPNAVQYSDLDLSFIPHPITGDINILTSVDAVKSSLKGLVLTSLYERPFHPEIGCLVNNLLFELNSPLLQANVQRTVEDVIQNYEPRVILLSVAVSSENSMRSMIISIEFQLITSPITFTFDVILQRIR